MLSWSFDDQRNQMANPFPFMPGRKSNIPLVGSLQTTWSQQRWLWTINSLLLRLSNDSASFPSSLGSLNFHMNRVKINWSWAGRILAKKASTRERWKWKSNKGKWKIHSAKRREKIYTFFTVPWESQEDDKKATVTTKTFPLAFLVCICSNQSPEKNSQHFFTSYINFSSKVQVSCSCDVTEKKCGKFAYPKSFMSLFAFIFNLCLHTTERSREKLR